MFVLRTSIPVGIASPAMLPEGGRDLAELRRLWDEDKAWLLACLDHLGPQRTRKAVLKHPIAGPVSVRQAVVMNRLHLERHIGQIRRLQKLLA
jgi:hypothetical protein